MADQAEALRQLAMQMTASPGTASGCTVLVMGAKRAVGTTTISGSLALALQRQGRPTVLVDADFDHPGLVPSWGIVARYTLADLIARRRTVREVLQPGPCGLQLVAGASRQEAARQGEAAGADLAAALQSLERQHWVVIDAGAGEVGEAVDRAVQVVLLVTTPDSRVLRQAYQRIKTLGSHHTAARLWCVMNQVPRSSRGAARPDATDAGLRPLSEPGVVCGRRTAGRHGVGRGHHASPPRPASRCRRVLSAAASSDSPSS